MSVRTLPRPVETAADLPRFCATCGAAMVVEDAVSGFDSRSGAPRYTALTRCSRRVWFGPDHDAFVVAPRPSSAVPPRPKTWKEDDDAHDGRRDRTTERQP